jgi:hypothetical protein
MDEQAASPAAHPKPPGRIQARKVCSKRRTEGHSLDAARDPTMDTAPRHSPKAKAPAQPQGHAQPSSKPDVQTQRPSKPHAKPKPNTTIAA